MFYHYRAALIITLFSFGVVSSQKIDSQKISQYIDIIEAKNWDKGSISIFENGTEVYSKQFGQIRNQDIRYQVGSVTKIFTATLIFKLIENEQLSLDTKLSDFFPDIQNADQITVRNLLEHTSGLGNYIKKEGKYPWLGKERSPQERLTEIQSQPVLFQPNEGVSYSNSAYYLLGKIVEISSKKSYSKFLKQQIINPLSLKDTHSAEEHAKHIAPSYHYDLNGWKLAQDFYFKNIVAVGDISSSMKDLNRFIFALFNAEILTPKSLQSMKPTLGQDVYGRGLMAFQFHGIDFVGHTGGTYGTNTILIYDEQSKISIALSINAERYPRDQFISDLVGILYKQLVISPELTNED